ncbi:MAG: response regulator [Methylococcales bacterium]|nr:response regulator [Methylococcales bacterium]
MKILPGSQTILVVEDNEDHAELIRFYLDDYVENIDIIWLRDGKEALDHIIDVRQRQESSYPWLILLDLNLPKYNGHEILLRLKSSPELSEIPVVIFTTSNASQDIQKALRRGANSYIQKPVEPELFASTLSEIVDYWTLNEHVRLINEHNHHV